MRTVGDQSETNSGRDLKCPHCGGNASPGDVRCPWCRSSLATIACPSCLAAVFVGIKHCPWCGTAVLAVTDLHQAGESCPRCDIPMVAVRVGKIHLNECRGCGGAWVTRQTFEDICRDQEQQEEVLGRPAEAAPRASNAKVKRVYIPCPVCRKLMNRMNFAGCSGVVVDWCKPHGIWLDHSELPQIIAFIQEGGLRRAREREKETLRAETRRLRMRELQLAAKEGRVPREEIVGSWGSQPDSLVDFLSSVWTNLKSD